MLKNSIGITASFLLLLGGISSFINYKSVIASLEQTMTEAVEVAASSLTHDLETYKVLANELSYNHIFNDETATKEEIKLECISIAKRSGFTDMDITDEKGQALISEYNIKDTDYFRKVKETGDVYISDPLFSNNIMVIIIAAPITRNNNFKGVVYMSLDANFLCNLVSQINIGRTGNASLINNLGDTIGYEDIQIVLDAYNTQVEAKSDSKLERRISKFADIAYETNQTSKAQADAISEVEKGINQIAVVVQSNSTSAQESSTSSEELSIQSENLKKLVGKFRLK